MRRPSCDTIPILGVAGVVFFHLAGHLAEHAASLLRVDDGSFDLNQPRFLVYNTILFVAAIFLLHNAFH
jgi:hypothetical protein